MGKGKKKEGGVLGAIFGCINAVEKGGDMLDNIENAPDAIAGAAEDAANDAADKAVDHATDRVEGAAEHAEKKAEKKVDKALG